tara:strand:+ start:73 stop:1095 length:1023 start_codon:yes stop_codon:yes gene_type:complete
MNYKIILFIISSLLIIIRENTSNILITSTILDPIVISFALGQVLRIVFINRKDIKLYIPVEKYLSIGIVLMGSQILISNSGLDNIKLIYIVISSVLLTFYLSLVLKKILNIQSSYAFLLIAGTCICGPAAISFVSKITRSSNNQIANAIWINTLNGFFIVIILPVIAYSLGLDYTQFGIWAGASIQSTAQVISSAAMYSDNSVQIAIIIKSLRILLLLPFMILISFHYSKLNSNPLNNRSLVIESIPPFMIWFIGIVLIFNFVDQIIIFNFSYSSIINNIFSIFLAVLKSLSKIFLSLSIFGISYSFNVFCKVNFNPKLILFSFGTSIILIISNYTLLIT